VQVRDIEVDETRKRLDTITVSGLFGECHGQPTSSHVNGLVPASGRLNVTFEVAASAKSGSWFGWLDAGRDAVHLR
jgi:hypothetical protein